MVKYEQINKESLSKEDNNIPYLFKKQGKKVKVVKKGSGKVVATAKDMKGAKGYAFHASKSDKQRYAILYI